VPARPGDKRPCIPWREFQARRASVHEIRAWYRRWPDAGVAIVCGGISGVVVIDFDPRNGDALATLAPRLPQTPTVESGGGGRHFYFATPLGSRIRKIAGILPGVDLQAEHALVTAPPSVHRSGRRYAWLPGHGLEDLSLAPLPPILRQLIALHRAPEIRLAAHAERGSGARLITLDAVLRRLAGARRVSSGWTVRCPAHNDREPSLSIATDASGRILLHCFAGCTFSQILGALRSSES
jgi:bifunctional DNA primase/polymerase-like protein